MQGQAHPLFFRLFFLLLLGSWLAGCATVAPITAMNGKPDTALQQRLTMLQHWNINGKLAVDDEQLAPELGRQSGFGQFLAAR